ncbi:SLAC1 family transporter [Nakamurella lactea]|uniref:SLAC1 family transporter n=1 Tax=Nakamurella lactea TaxID=459515 RepID=UPI00041C4006|nr:hypothetical protein [Nakamurella lactea]
MKHTSADHQSPTATLPPVRITPNLFAISLGLAGLAQTWTLTTRVAGTPPAIADGLWLVAGAAWLITLLLYLRSVRQAGRWHTELSDHVFGPFVSIPAIVGLLLAGGLEPHAHMAGLVLFVVSLIVALALAGHLLAVWAMDDAPSTHWHPGYYLPSVGAPIVAAGEAAVFGAPGLARLLFGFGILSWVLIGGILLHHLVGLERLPKPLIPTMAILIAPPVVAGNAWFAINGGRADGIALGLAGYSVLMATVQLSLIRAYRTAPFGPGWWSYSFPYAATVGNAIGWVWIEHVPHATLVTYLLLSAITAFVGMLAVRTVVRIARRTFLPRLQPVAVSPTGLPAMPAAFGSALTPAA